MSEDGICHWYLYNPVDKSVVEEALPIWESIRCGKDAPRVLILGNESFASIRKEMEKHIRNTYLKSIQAPLGAKPRLVTWMELV